METSTGFGHIYEAAHELSKHSAEKVSHEIMESCMSGDRQAASLHQASQDRAQADTAATHLPDLSFSNTGVQSMTAVVDERSSGGSGAAVRAGGGGGGDSMTAVVDERGSGGSGASIKGGGGQEKRD